MGKLREATPEEIAEYKAQQSAPKPKLREATPDEIAEYQKTQAKPKQTSTGIAAFLGGGDYASFGFGDELTGVANAALQSGPGRWLREKTGIMAPYEGEEVPATTADAYRAGRDSHRELNATAAGEHPIAYHGTGLATAIVNPTGAAAKGAGFLGKLAAGAKVGAAQGLGSSTADVTKGDVKGAMSDAGIGALFGGAGTVVGEGVSRGAKAVGGKIQGGLRRRILNEVAEGDTGMVTTPTQRKHLDKAGDAIFDEVVHGPDAAKVRGAFKGPADKGRKAVGEVLAPVFEANDKGYEAFAAKGRAAIDPKAYAQALRDKAVQRADEGRGTDAQNLMALADDFDALVGMRSKKDMDLKSLRKFTTEQGAKSASAIGGLQPHSRAAALNRLTAEASEAMDDALSRAAVGDPELEAAAASIRANNKRINALKTADSAMARRQDKENSAASGIMRAAKAAAGPTALGGAAAVTSGDDERLENVAKGAAIGFVGSRGLPYVARSLERARTSAGIAAAQGRGPSAETAGRAARGVTALFMSKKKREKERAAK